MIRPRDSRSIAATARGWRTIALSVLTVGRPFPLLGFRAVDSHIHAVLACGAEDAAEFGRRVEISIQRRLRLGVGFAEVHCVPVVDQRHLSNVFWYAMDNARKHGAQVDPLFEASNLPDLLGMRLLGRWTAPELHARLPRLRQERLWELMPVRPVAGHVDHELLLESAAAAVGYPTPRLLARAPSRTQDGWGPDALTAAAHCAPQLGTTAIARLLRTSPSTARRARRTEPDPRLLKAVQLQLAVRSAWATAKLAEATGRRA